MASEGAVLPARLRPGGLRDAESWLRAASAAAAIVVVALLCFIPLSTNDFWVQAAVGREIWTGGAIPRTALFPFTEARDLPFHAHEWLCSLFFYLLESALGHERLIFVKGLLGFALFALCWRLAHRLLPSFGLSLVVAVGAMVLVNYRFWLRPELFALLYTALLMNLLVKYRLSGKRSCLAACVPLALLWVNSHGSAPLALVVAAAFAAGAALERRPALPYVACAAAMALAMLVNPYGPSAFSFAWQLQQATFLRANIYEWMATLAGPFVGTAGYWAFIAYLALFIGLLAAARFRVPPAAALLALVFGYLALRTQRHIVFFAITSIFPLCAALAAAAPRWPYGRFARGGVLALLLATAGLLVRYGNMYGGFPYYVPSYSFSLLMVEYLENPAVRGNVLNSYALGGELAYRFYPRLRPAIDSRVDVYGEDYVEELERVKSDEHAFREFAARYDVRYVLLLWPEFDEGLRRFPALQREGWRMVFADHKMVLLGRQAKEPTVTRGKLQPRARAVH
jgi:hypothetical protein